jgi:hypothetical protein
MQRKNNCFSASSEVMSSHLQKMEACYWPQQGSIDKLNYALSQWMKKYNYTRRHTGFRMNRLTPAQKVAYTFIQNTLHAHPKNVNLMLQQHKN